MLTDKSEEVEMDEQMKRFITAYKHGIVSKEQLYKTYPELNELLDEVKDEVTQNFQKQFENLSSALITKSQDIQKELESVKQVAFEARKESKEMKKFLKKYWPYIIGTLQGVLEYKQVLLDAPYIRYVSTSFAISSLIEREISKTFGKPKGKLGIVSYYLFLLFFTGIIASYMQSLDWCVFYGKELYPILQMRLKNLTTETFSKLLNEAQIQQQKLGSEKVGIGMALGKQGFDKLKDIFSGLLVVASSYHMGKLSADDIEVDETEIDPEIVNKYKDVKPKFKTPEKTVSPTVLITGGELAGLTQRFTKIELLASEVALYIGGGKEPSVLNPSSLKEPIDLIKRIKDELENPDVKVASNIFNKIQDKMLYINKDAAKYVDYRSLSLTAESIDNNIESNIKLINADIDYALNKVGESWNSRTLFFPKGPSIKNLIKASSNNPEVSAQDIALHAIDYMLVFFVIIFPLLTFTFRQTKKAYKYYKGKDKLSIEVLEQRLRYSY